MLQYTVLWFILILFLNIIPYKNNNEMQFFEAVKIKFSWYLCNFVH